MTLTRRRLLTLAAASTALVSSSTAKLVMSTAFPPAASASPLSRRKCVPSRWPMVLRCLIDVAGPLLARSKARLDSFIQRSRPRQRAAFLDEALDLLEGVEVVVGAG